MRSDLRTALNFLRLRKPFIRCFSKFTSARTWNLRDSGNPPWSSSEIGFRLLRFTGCWLWPPVLHQTCSLRWRVDDPPPPPFTTPLFLLYNRPPLPLSFPFSLESACRGWWCSFGCLLEIDEGRPPIKVKFEIPYFTVSGIQVTQTRGSSCERNVMLCIKPGE